MILEAAERVAAGEVIGIPTDTVYGLASRLDCAEAIFGIKGRPDGVALPILVANVDAAVELASTWPASAADLAGDYWPGALTIVVRAEPRVARLVGGEDSIGLRVPDDGDLLALLAVTGPLAVTSANRHGDPPAHESDEVRAWFDGFVVDGGRCDRAPSTVVDCTRATPRILRAGTITIE